MDQPSISTAPIELQPVESSQIDAVGHDPETNTLAVRFRAGAGSIGRTYHYGGVDAALFEQLRKAKSIGSFFHKTIKPNVSAYPYVKIDTRSER